jgi:hypothetical protein
VSRRAKFDRDAPRMESSSIMTERTLISNQSFVIVATPALFVRHDRNSREQLHAGIATGTTHRKPVLAAPQ